MEKSEFNIVQETLFYIYYFSCWPHINSFGIQFNLLPPNFTLVF